MYSRHTIFAASAAAPAVPLDRTSVGGWIAGHEELCAIHEGDPADGTDPMARGASMAGITRIDSHPETLRAIRTSLS